MHNRALKKIVRDLLIRKDLEEALGQLFKMNLRRVISPLFSFFYSGDEVLRWHAITAAGAVISKMAVQKPDHARIMMRRLMWNLNDESGGIGWGSPEAMGETMARSARMAEEYAAILVSYLNPHGNFLEHEGLQCGVLWGVGRLANSRGLMVSAAAPFLGPFMDSANPYHRGLATWCARALSSVAAVTIPTHIFKDTAVIRLYVGEAFRELPIYQLATETGTA